MADKPGSDALKEKERRLRGGFDDDVGLRVHRAVSWLQGADRAAADDDLDTAFICYWIAFNAVYVQAGQLHQRYHEREFFNWFFEQVCELDADNVIYDAIWQRFSQSIRSLVDNHFVFAPFWRHQHGEQDSAAWQSWFEGERKRILAALGRRDTVGVLTVVFDRLYVLRNQLMHGGATWNSTVNRAQVRDGTAILAFLVPHFVELMMDNPAHGWGVPPYPVVDGAGASVETRRKTS